MIFSKFEGTSEVTGPYWNVFPDEDKNSTFLYYLSTVGNTSDKFENIYYEPNYEKEHTSIYDSIKFSNQKNSEKMWHSVHFPTNRK